MAEGSEKQGLKYTRVSYVECAHRRARIQCESLHSIRTTQLPVSAGARCGAVRNRMKTIMFACVHNAGRSQMAAALFNRRANPAKARALSAGTRPADRVHPAVVQVMLEDGIDLSAAHPQQLTPELAAQAQLLITMGCGEECPVVPGIQRDDWPLDDPKGQSMARVREIRDQIRGLVDALIVRENFR